MTAVTILFALAAIYYLIATVTFAIGLIRRRDERSTEKPFVSVVIAARNEDAYLGRCLDSLGAQTYPTDRYEILVVDDDSTDRTRQVAEQYDAVRVLSPLPAYADYAAKKRPMASGIAEARGDLILTTDADCTTEPGWIEATVSHFTENVDVVVGYSSVAPVGQGWVHRLQAFDFFAMLAAAAGAIGAGSLWAATGQNLAYRKRLFDRVGGYTSVAGRASGDDVLLAQLFRKAGAQATFCFDPAGHTTTWRVESLRGLIRQRTRWASNARVQAKLNPALFLYVTSVLSINILPILALAAGGHIASLCLIAWGLRFLTDATITVIAARRLRVSPGLLFLPAWMLLQVPYVLIVGFAGSLLGFEWKNRQHRSTASMTVTYPPTNQRGTSHAKM